MSPSCCCNCLCLSSRRQQEQDQDLLIPEDEPNAFDLTWRNYLLPSSCIPNIFKRQQPIRLSDDDDRNVIDPHDELFISPNYYQGRAVRGYLDDPRDWEFDSMLHNEQQQFPEFVTRNPFGRKNSKKKRKHKKHQHNNNYPRVVRDGEVDGDEEEIFSEDIQDAEFLGDDQIAHLAYERSKSMDPYGEEGYIDSAYDRPISQEMQPPPAHKEFYAPKTMPYYFVNEENDDNFHHDEYHDEPRVVQQQKQRPPEQQQQQQCEASSSSATHIATVAEQAQDLLSERLDDLTDKLVYIRQNMMDLNKKKEQEPDNTTLHTIKKKNNDNDNKGPGSDKTASDMDSIASEALDEYERPNVDDIDDDDDDDRRRRRSGASQYRFPFGGGDSPPFGSDHHPFSYFTDHSNHRRNASTASASSLSPPNNNNSSDDNTPGLNLRGVLDFGKRWLGA